MVKIKIEHRGNIGNRMFQYAYCRLLQQRVADSSLVQYDLPEFSLHATCNESLGRTLNIPVGHVYRTEAIAYQLNHGIYDNVNFNGYAQRMEYYASHRDFIASLFKSSFAVPHEHLGADSILINIRAAEVLGNTHPDMGPVPIAFFEQIVAETALKPVIIGQLGDNDYSREIRRRFPTATVLPRHSTLGDFQTVRHATNVVIGVSSFSWMASWLGHAKCIYLPVSGIFNPKQRNDVDLLPVSDSRYHFYDFPVTNWQATTSQVQDLLKPHVFSKMTHEAIAKRIDWAR